MGRLAVGILLLISGLLATTASVVGQTTGIDPALVAEGEADFTAELSPEDGLGPRLNGRSCVACHSTPSVGGTGAQDLGAVLRVGRLVDGAYDPLVGQGGPVARAHSVQELGYPCSLPFGIPQGANLTSLRVAPQLFGLGLVDQIPDEVILQNATAELEAVRGRPNVVDAGVSNHSVGRFGWKGDNADLQSFAAGALRNELGVTNPLAPDDLLPAQPASASPCPGQSAVPKDDGTRVRALWAFVASLPAPAPNAADDPALTHGAQVFAEIGCAACHVPSLQSPTGAVGLYSDLLLHDMGSDLDDGVVQVNARGRDWRTTPLWGLGQRSRYLHDGRARNLVAAVGAHGGQAASASSTFRALSSEDREALLAFLRAL